MSSLHALAERTALKYAANCKCGECQCVPSELIINVVFEMTQLRAACLAAWTLGHKVYHSAATPDAPDWVITRKLLAEALGKPL